MCSYNKINGSHACGSRSALKSDLKGAMGFNGFVVSDWSTPAGIEPIEARHSSSAHPVLA